MNIFFTEQLDYIYFFYGLAFLAQSIIIFYAHFQAKLKLPLIWLGMFAFVVSMVQFANLAVTISGNQFLLSLFRATGLSIAFAFLFEFGRSGLSKYNIKTPGRWIYLIPGTILCAGAFFGGSAGFQTAASYSLGITGALTTAAVFAIAYKHEKQQRPYYLIFSGFFIVGALIIALGVPQTLFPPTSIFNYQSFSNFSHIPLEMFCTVFGALFAIILSIFVYEVLDYSKKFRLGIKMTILYLPICIILTILISGWALTNSTSSNFDQSRKHNFLHLAIVSSTTINNSQITSLTGTLADLEDENYTQIKKQLMNLRRNLNLDGYKENCRFIYLIGMRNDKVFFIADSEPENSSDISFPGDIYDEASEQIVKCFSDGLPIVEGPTTDRWGKWITGVAAIRDRSGKVIALLGIDTDAKKWQRSYALIRLSVITTIGMLSLLIMAAVVALHLLVSAATKRLNAVEALEKSEAKYKTLVENLNVGIFNNTLENGRCFTDANLALARLFGCETVEEFKKHSVLDFYRNPVDRYNYIQKIKEFGFVKHYELALKKKDGTLITTSLNAQAEFGEDGKIKSIVGIIEDITERKKIYEELRRSRETMKKIIDSMPFGIVIVDKNKAIRLINNKAAEMTGCVNPSELLGKRCHRFICPSLEGKCPVLDLHENIDMSERVIKTQNGKTIPVLKSVTPIIFENQEVLLESFVDITERKEAEEKMRELNRNLEEANEEMKHFAYIASHDLREPLRKIMSFGSILEKTIKDKIEPEENENLLFVVDAAKRMSTMIDGLLSYSRVSTKGHEFENISLDEIIEGLELYELGMLIEETHTIINIPQPLPTVYADMLQMRQLLQNLIANGIKYQPKGNVPEITITTKPAANDMLRVEITDNGIGISPEYHNSIFGMFKRLHTNKEYEGTGIGLAVCKRIAQRHNGLIGIESQAGKGSTFWFTVAAAKVTAPVA
jgi:PAS domain S-box-containing protein